MHTLGAQLFTIATMARLDGCDPIIAQDLETAARRCEEGKIPMVRYRLRTMKMAVTLGGERTVGAEEHIALAIAAFEAVHGEVG